MYTSLPELEVSVNRLYAGDKLVVRDRRWARFNGAFRQESHTLESLLAEIRQGHSFAVYWQDVTLTTAALGGVALTEGTILNIVVVRLATGKTPIS